MTDSPAKTNFPAKILLYTDGSEDAALAAPVVVSLAEKSGAELHLVHVWHTAAPFAPPSWFRDDAQRRLDEEIQHIQNAGGTVTETHLRKGHTAEEVVNLSDELEADLIVVGVVMGVGSAERKILEGLSDDIVHHAQCPVMVMRTREQTEAVR